MAATVPSPQSPSIALRYFDFFGSRWAGRVARTRRA
jgi:hypothetical protein